MKKHFYDFLLNQMNVVSNMATMEDAPTTKKEIIKLTEYIRYKFGRKGEIVKLQDEITAVHQIISLFKVRLGENLIYTEKIENGSKGVYLPHYTIITFIENCLVHAFQRREGICKVNINIVEASGGYQVTIMDNGQGFKGFSDILGGKVPDSSIFAIHEKLKDFFDSQQGIVIESSSQGTKILLHILK